MTSRRFSSFPARFASGECELCGDPLEVDQEIGYDENGDLVHADCYSEPGKSKDEPRKFKFGQ